jgi:hypothetical protein
MGVRRFPGKAFAGPALRGLCLGLVCLGLAATGAWSLDHWGRPAPPPPAAPPPAPPSPLVGKPAPPLRLPTLSGDRTVELSRLRGRRVVLVFGSFSCDLFCGHLERLGRLYTAHKGRAEFFFVSLREAGHEMPGLEFLVEDDGRVTPRQRRERTAKAIRLKGFPLPALFDVDDKASDDYKAFPLRLVAVGAGGTVELDLGRDLADGEAWAFDRLEAWLGAKREADGASAARPARGDMR